MLRAAAETFETSPCAGSTTDSRTENTTTCVFSPLKTTLMLIAVFSSHNHSCVMLSNTYPFADKFPEENVVLRDDQVTEFGRDMMSGLIDAAKRLKDKLVPVEVSWGVGHERRISYNRKGRRADGSTYLIREEDRLLLGPDFNGDIDDSDYSSSYYRYT